MSQKSTEKKDSFLENGLKLIKQCPLCDQKYNKKSLQVIEQNEETRLVHLTCADCSQGMLAVFLATRLGVSSIGILTDLTAGDVTRFQKKQIITEDDILSFHSILKSKKIKNISHLFI
jgi:hypothetical protein